MAKKQNESEQAVEPANRVIAAHQEQGFRGVKVDPTPNENYTLAGVTKGLPTPETDADLRRETLSAAEERAQTASRFPVRKG